MVVIVVIVVIPRKKKLHIIDPEGTKRQCHHRLWSQPFTELLHLKEAVAVAIRHGPFLTEQTPWCALKDIQNHQWCQYVNGQWWLMMVDDGWWWSIISKCKTSSVNQWWQCQCQSPINNQLIIPSSHHPIPPDQSPGGSFLERRDGASGRSPRRKAVGFHRKIIGVHSENHL